MLFCMLFRRANHFTTQVYNNTCFDLVKICKIKYSGGSEFVALIVPYRITPNRFELSHFHEFDLKKRGSVAKPHRFYYNEPKNTVFRFSINRESFRTK